MDCQRRSKRARLKPSERDFLKAVLDLARLYKWRCFHPLPGMNQRGQWATFTQGDVGFPDLVLVRGDRLLFAELKAGASKPTKSQAAWLECLAQVPHIEVYLWRPSDWQSIVNTLR